MALPAPRHVNQFTAGGRFPDGTPSGRYDCTVAVGVMALDAFTGGRLVVSTTELRSRQRDQDGPGALSPGIGLDDVAEAWRSYGYAFRHGGAIWTTILGRLGAGLGVAVQGKYLALGDWRAPGSSYAGGHAMYLQRSDPKHGILVNDPLRTSAVWIPSSVVLRYYVSGLALAGWGTGTTAGDAIPASSEQLGAFNDLVSFPVGHVITQADVDYIMATLNAAHYWSVPGSNPVSEAQAADTTRRILTGIIGRTWNKALQDEIAGSAHAAADQANAIGAAIGSLPDAIGTVLRSTGLFLGLLVLAMVGLYLVARGR